MPRQGGVGRQREKFLAGAQPRLPLVSTPQTSMEQTRVHRTGHALARAKDLLAMSIPSRMAGPPISGATDMEAPPSSRIGGMMSLHAAARAAAPGHLVLYRVGEFYEVLGPDAAIVSRTLGIQLTRRRQKDAADIPMCGVPASTLDATTARLLAAGHKVAVSEQATEDGGDRPLRLLTPGTSVEAPSWRRTGRITLPPPSLRAKRSHSPGSISQRPRRGPAGRVGGLRAGDDRFRVNPGFPGVRCFRHSFAPWLVSQSQDGDRRGGRESVPPRSTSARIEGRGPGPGCEAAMVETRAAERQPEAVGPRLNDPPATRGTGDSPIR